MVEGNINWILELGVVLLLSKIISDIFQKLKISPVLGEILVGIILGTSFLGVIHGISILHIFGEVGVIFMILLIGMETNLGMLLKVGKVAILVATMGVIIPLLGGYYLGKLYNYEWQVSLFLGSILTATSVAVTIRVLMDLGMGRSEESQTILAAALIDDVLGILVLSGVLALIGSSDIGIGRKIVDILIFFLILFPILWIISNNILKRFENTDTVFILILGLTFLSSYLAEVLGLATIIGGFLIGIILSSKSKTNEIIERLKPLYFFMAPIFFVSIGAQVDLKKLLTSLIFTTILILISIITKTFGGLLGALLGGINFKKALIIGVGMVPRGEVGLIIAGIGRAGGVIDDSVFAAATLMCLVTIMFPPFIIKSLMKKSIKL
jgi:Kef-type K+ transport system membrane component KefB